MCARLETFRNLVSCALIMAVYDDRLAKFDSGPLNQVPECHQHGHVCNLHQWSGRPGIKPLGWATDGSRNERKNPGVGHIRRGVNCGNIQSCQDTCILSGKIWKIPRGANFIPRIPHPSVIDKKSRAIRES